MDLELFKRRLQEKCALDLTQPVVVGFSGGADSLCLLNLLVEAGVPVVAAHLNHRLRPGADEEVEVVRQLAHKSGAVVVTDSQDVRAAARQRHVTIEEAARICRYTFLFQVARVNGAQAVAVGHTGDDQAETVLMHLLRGSGISGLSGMRWRSLLEGWDENIPLVRPLLDWTHAQTLAFCLQKSLTPLEDDSNRDTTFFRNRLRHQLLPYLAGYNPAIRQVLQRSADVLAGDSELLDELTQQAWEKCSPQCGPGWVIFHRSQVSQFPPALQRRMVRQALRVLRPTLRDIDFGAVERAVEFIQSPSRSRRVHLMADFSLSLENDELLLTDKNAQPYRGQELRLMPGEVLELPIPGEICLQSGWTLTAALIDPSNPAAGARLNEEPYAAWLDAEKLRANLRIRSRQPGDRFQPLGLAEGSVKISDFMVNNHIPRSARVNWPLVFSGDELIWLPGYRPAHFCRWTETTRRYLWLRLLPPAGAVSG